MDKDSEIRFRSVFRLQRTRTFKRVYDSRSANSQATGSFNNFSVLTSTVSHLLLPKQVCTNRPRII